jgi:hypothetical protein
VRSGSERRVSENETDEFVAAGNMVGDTTKKGGEAFGAGGKKNEGGVKQ